ncbi:hypothetical protein BGW36DRAFT_367172 [Talaromyces proteolyticus]|uniref:Zn(2)-C6 fungal-type domain-containing protein n=1 Tax=Talaromyces proteolyticus TaxID=1131652 RepID=A0AAD4L779_9EURO|nr:uncharacterized protein BGW36DRAFT_367172 [Talaromyces proteolyticus]KAH8705244.1 hypothetical protein BGW36DRAFT_367172 [Talaromyces proteolyticus]
MLLFEGPSLRLACDRCHKRKQRCTRTGISDNKPCERCTEAGAQCVYSPPSRLGRPSNKSKRERERSNSVAQHSSVTSSAKSLPSSTTTTPPPPSLSSSSSPSCMPVTSSRNRTKPRRSQSTATAVSLRVGASSPSTPSQFSEGVSSPSSYHFGSPPLHALDVVNTTPFQHALIPRSQPRQYREEPVLGPLSFTSRGHNNDGLSVAPGQQQGWNMISHHNNNTLLGSEPYDNHVALMSQQPLYDTDIWSNTLASPNSLQFHQTAEEPLRLVDPNTVEYARWKWNSNTAEDPNVPMNISTPVTMTGDGNQQWAYYW